MIFAHVCNFCKWIINCGNFSILINFYTNMVYVYTQKHIYAYGMIDIYRFYIFLLTKLLANLVFTSSLSGAICFSYFVGTTKDYIYIHVSIVR